MTWFNKLRAQIAAGAALMLAAAATVYSALIFVPSEQPYGHAPALAISGFDVSRGDQRVFQAWFDPYVWRGDLVAYPVDATGRTETENRLWYASERLKLQNWDTGRRIVTSSGGVGVPFRFDSLSVAQQTSLGGGATAAKLVAYVRGDRSNEKEFIEEQGDGTLVVLSGSPTGTLRARASVLGDIIHGKPLYVGPPPGNHLFDGYSSFKSANANRPGVVYVGANDGMLHAFSAATGDEIFAYVPSMLIPALPRLAVDPYAHTYFVDGGLAAGDVYAGGATGWRTVLVGGLGAGGKGLFALDVTSAAAPDETAAKAKVLWEITSASAGFENLGYTYGDPVLVKLNTGRWAAVVGNGYNNMGTGHAVLYVIDVMTGALIRAISTGKGSLLSPNGLSAPTPVDTNADGTVDFIYAGDIDGELWKFDLRSATPGAWTAAEIFSGSRPIVAAPDVSGHPLGGFIVHFATGSLFSVLESIDKTVQNYVYGIWDGAPPANQALLEQTLAESLYGQQRVRVSSGKAINWNDSSDPVGKPLHRGWRTALAPGEHVVSAGFVRDGRYHFTATNASTINATRPNGENWLIELDHLNGAATDKLIFDLSGDGTVTDADRVQSGGGPVAGPTGIPVGVYLGPGLYSAPLMALISSRFSTTLFNRNPAVSPGDIPTIPPVPPVGGGGVANGHFDLDVYHGINMASFKHVHEYDDKYDVTGVNFLNASDPSFNLANTSSPGNRVTSSSRFFVLVSNGDLSPGVTLTVGGKEHKAYAYPNKFDGTQPIYTLSSAARFHFRMPQDAFEAKDWGNGVVRPGLFPTSTGCVKSATPTPGVEGEVHNGALTVWIVKEGTPASAIQLNVPGKPEKGYKVVNDAWVLKKYTVFWHNGACYGTPAWVQNPPSNYRPDTGTALAPAPGSDDPKGGSPGEVPPTAVNTTTTFIASATYNGTSDKSGTRVTTTVYTDGSKVIVTETLDKKGRVTRTTTSRVTPTAPTAPGSPIGGAPPSEPPNVRTGYNQSRQGGRIGRVAWRELIKE